MKSISIDNLFEIQKDEGLKLQHDFVNLINKKNQKNQNNKTIFQNIQKTNNILKQKKIDSSNLEEYTNEQLADMLEVDAIVKGNMKTNQPMSSEASLALGTLLGTNRDLFNLGIGVTDVADCFIEVFDGSSGELLWKRRKVVARSSDILSRSVSKIALKKLSIKFPY